MLYEFKSRATGTVTMTESVGRQVIEVIGKTVGPQGIITVDQIPAAIAALKAAAKREHRQADAGTTEAAAGTEDDDDIDRNRIGFGTRVVPLIEMLEAAHRAGKDVTWGV